MKLFVRMALEQYYLRYCQEVQKVEVEALGDNDVDGDKEWLS